MKKFIFGVIIGAVLFSFSPLKASDLLEVAHFPAKIIINGEHRLVDEEYTTLNYKGHAYVPVRFIAEALHSKVNYRGDQEKIISINDPEAELPAVYPKELAINNGDVVFISQNQSFNEEQVTEFIANVANSKNDWIRIVRFTLEGDPIIQQLVYNDGELNHTIDSTRDKFGAGEKKEYVCSSIVGTSGNLNGEHYTDYTLTGCTPEQESIKFYRLFSK